MIDKIKKLALDKELFQYFIVSLASLLVDMMTLSFCIRVLHISWYESATIGFCLGVMTSYYLSIKIVFKNRVLKMLPKIEFLVFVSIGLCGLILTQLILWIGITKLHIIPEVVKFISAIFTFFFNFLIRKYILF